MDTLLFTPTIDDRYEKGKIHSRIGLYAEAIPFDSHFNLFQYAENQIHNNPKLKCVLVDEAQFFNQDLVTVCQTLADRGIRVIVAGLDQDYRGVPFEPIPQLLAVAEYITKNNAICVVCGNPASRSQRIVAEGDRVVVGAQEAYEARCRLCFDAKLHEKIKQKEEKHAKSKTTHRQPEVRA